MNIKFKNTKLLIVVVYSVLIVMLNAQATSIPAVAILDFESRGLPTYEVETLTERHFPSNIAHLTCRL